MDDKRAPSSPTRKKSKHKSRSKFDLSEPWALAQCWQLRSRIIGCQRKKQQRKTMPLPNLWFVLYGNNVFDIWPWKCAVNWWVGNRNNGNIYLLQQQYGFISSSDVGNDDDDDESFRRVRSHQIEITLFIVIGKGVERWYEFIFNSRMGFGKSTRAPHIHHFLPAFTPLLYALNHSHHVLCWAQKRMNRKKKIIELLRSVLPPN